MDCLDLVHIEVNFRVEQPFSLRVLSLVDQDSEHYSLYKYPRASRSIWAINLEVEEPGAGTSTLWFFYPCPHPRSGSHPRRRGLVSDLDPLSLPPTSMG